MRTIGIRHRIKKNAEGEARPTQVVIISEGKPITELELEAETDELDFVLGRFPTKHIKVDATYDISAVPPHQVKWRKMKEAEADVEFHASQIRKPKGSSKFEIGDRIPDPDSSEGLRSGDRVAMILGGSGDNLAFAFARRGQDIGATVHRLPPFVFKELRGKAAKGKDEDARILADSLVSSADLFYQVGPRDLSLIWLRECLRYRVDAMKARIACEQRLRQWLFARAI